MEREVDDRVVAMEAVVASSKEGGVQGRRSGRPVGGGNRHLMELPPSCPTQPPSCSIFYRAEPRTPPWAP